MRLLQFASTQNAESRFSLDRA